MNRIAQILANSMTEAEKAALTAVAHSNAETIETNHSKLSDLRLIEQSTDHGFVSLTKLGVQVLQKF